MSEQLVYDFEDGKGLVPAHRHVNPDGTIGGWVADTATVVSTAYIGPNARVYGSVSLYDNVTVDDYAHVYDDAQICNYASIHDNAQVYGNAYIHDNAHIYGNAHVCDEVEIYGDAQIYGNSRIYDRTHIKGNVNIFDNVKVSECSRISGHAHIGGDACITDTKDYMVIGPLGNDNRYTTFTKHPIIRATTGCFTGTLEEFLKAVNRKHGDSDLGKEYKEAVEYIKRIWG